MPLSKTSRQKEQLIQQLTLSRSAMLCQKDRVQQALDVKTQVTKSVRKAPAKWAIGSVITGLVGSQVIRFRKSKKQKVNRQTVKKTKGNFLYKTFISVLVSLIKPAMKNYLKSRISLPFKRAK